MVSRQFAVVGHIVLLTIDLCEDAIVGAVLDALQCADIIHVLLARAEISETEVIEDRPVAISNLLVTSDTQVERSVLTYIHED